MGDEQSLEACGEALWRMMPPWGSEKTVRGGRGGCPRTPAGIFAGERRSQGKAPRSDGGSVCWPSDGWEALVTPMGCPMRDPSCLDLWHARARFPRALAPKSSGVWGAFVDAKR